MTAHLRDTIAKAALLGLERAKPELPSAAGALGAAIGDVPDGEFESRWLDASALATLHAEAGRLPPKGKPECEPCPQDQRPVCRLAARNYLSAMLSGRFEIALPGWIRALDAAGYRVPEVQVPALLEIARKNRQASDAIRRCCGEVGSWLAAQHPEWRALGVATRSHIWTDGNINERAEWLKSVREHDPAGALRALQEVWASEGSREKATLLNCLTINLSMADEAFLESALDDKRKEVRQPAAKLLSRIPESLLVQRMRDRLKPLLCVDKRGKVSVALPDELGKDAERDGIERSSQTRELGDKASWLMQMVACVPPMEWCAGGATPAAILKHADKTDWALALRLGWSIAAGSHPDAAWISALLEKPVSSSSVDVAGRMLRRLPQPEREAALQKLGNLEHINVYTWPEFVPFEWSENLTVAAAKLLQAELKAWKDVRWSLDRLPRIAACMNVASADQVAKLLNPEKQTQPEAADAVRELIDLLRFRREALNAIKEKP